MPLFNPVFLYTVSHPFILVFTWLNFQLFLMFVNSEMIITESESIACIEFWLRAFHPKENLKYHGNFCHHEWSLWRHQLWGKQTVLLAPFMEPLTPGRVHMRAQCHSRGKWDQVSTWPMTYWSRVCITSPLKFQFSKHFKQLLLQPLRCWNSASSICKTNRAQQPPRSICFPLAGTYTDSVLPVWRISLY